MKNTTDAIIEILNLLLDANKLREVTPETISYLFLEAENGLAPLRVKAAHLAEIKGLVNG